MKDKKTHVGKHLLIVLCLVIFGVAGVVYNITMPRRPVEMDLSKFACRLYEVVGGKSELTCVAIPYKNLQNSLVLITVNHFFDEASPKKTEVVFPSGKILPVGKVQCVNKDMDVAYVFVDSQGLELGKDYGIPDFTYIDFVHEQKKITIFNDSPYVISPRIVQKVFKTPYRYCLATGDAIKGQSGSPVFLSDSKTCIGLLTGYYEKYKDQGSLIKIVNAPDWVGTR